MKTEKRRGPDGCRMCHYRLSALEVTKSNLKELCETTIYQYIGMVHSLYLSFRVSAMGNCHVAWLFRRRCGMGEEGGGELALGGHPY